MNNEPQPNNREVAPHPKRIEPGPGQESVWDYPRPPAVAPDDRLVEVLFNGNTIASTRRAIRVLETSQPPAFYIPREDVIMKVLRQTSRRTVCEWKGLSNYYTVEVDGQVSRNAAWSYPDLMPRYQAIKNHLAFYPQLVDACFVSGEQVESQPGGFYGGWITSDIVGPFKGAPGTLHW